jgi:hypothetical protein
VLRPSGEIWWSWPYRKISRFIDPQAAAVSHACDAIAIPGQPGYKYTWIVDRGGRAVSVSTTSVPAGAAFDRTGNLVAIGSFGGTLELVTRAGTLQWKRDVKDARILRDLQFTDDNRHIVSTGWAGPAVVEVDGTVVWGGLANRMAFSRDLTTFVFGNEPNHGPGYSSFEVTDRHQKTLFSRLGSTETYVSATGDRVLATVHRLPDQLKGSGPDDSNGGGCNCSREPVRCCENSRTTAKLSLCPTTARVFSSGPEDKIGSIALTTRDECLRQSRPGSAIGKETTIDRISNSCPRGASSR